MLYLFFDFVLNLFYLAFVIFKLGFGLFGVKNIAFVIQLLLSLTQFLSIVGKILNLRQDCKHFELFLSKLNRNDLRAVVLLFQLLVKLFFVLQYFFKMQGEFYPQGFGV